MEEVPITLGTLSGCTHCFNLPTQATVFQGKCWIAEELGRPAELQRWLVDGAILEDANLLTASLASDSKAPLEILCVFLPRTFDVQVKVVKFSPGAQAQSSNVVTISVSPMMTIDAAKFEALSAASDALGAGSVDVSKAARLIKGGLHLQDDRTIEYYHINPDATLHLVIPRGRASDNDMPSNASGVSDAYENYSTPDEAQRELETFHKLSSEDGSKDDIIKKSPQEEEDKGILSPRTKEAAFAFNSMGVHRLRPRRCRSVPVSKSKAMSESKCEEPKDKIAPTMHSQKDCVVQCESTKCGLQPAEACSAEASVQACQSLASSLHVASCNPQKPSGPKAAPSRPLRSRSVARVGCPASPAQAMHTLLQMHSEEESAHSPPKEESRPPTPTMSVVRPPRMPRAKAVAEKSELERPSCSRGQRVRNVPSARPTSQNSEPKLWAKDWAELFAPPKRGDAQLARAPLRRSSSCRPQGIDRFHFVARLH